MSENTENRTYSGYLMVDWRSDRLRFRKTEPNKLDPTEIAVPVSVSVDVPQIDVPSIDVAVDVPPANVEHAVAEAAERIAPYIEEEQ